MWLWTLVHCALIVSILAIRVPVDNRKDETAEAGTDSITASNKQNKPIYYAPDEASIDSYLIPPDPHKPVDVASDVDAPPTYLLPPDPNQQSEYYVPIETSEQTDWYPIVESIPKAKPLNVLPQRPIHIKGGVPIYLGSNEAKVRKPQNVRGAKSVVESEHIPYLVPSQQLEPPIRELAQEDGSKESSRKELPVANSPPSQQQQLPSEHLKRPFKVPSPSIELELPLPNSNKNFNPRPKNVPATFHLIPVQPTLAIHLTPPKPISLKYKNPTKLYPKKYFGGFRPVPIPIAQFADDTSLEIPIARPLTPFNPNAATGNDYYIPYDEKKIHQFDQAEQKRKIKQEYDTKEQGITEIDSDEQQSESDENAEQQASETANFRLPGRNSYPAPLRQAPPQAPPADQHAPAPAGERTEFRMHGMKGPHSYQFGYDTGKGKNRQFRFEERDNDGKVKGHYGYMDRSGKLRVVNYNADPEHGFHAEAPVEKQ